MRGRNLLRPGGRGVCIESRRWPHFEVGERTGVVELEYPGMEFSDQLGVVAPAGTPPDVLERLSKALADIVAEPDTKDRLGRWGMEPARLGPSEFRRLIHSELQRYGRLVRDGRITVE